MPNIKMIIEHQKYLRLWKKIIFLYYDTSHDTLMDIWFTPYTLYRIPDIRPKLDDIKLVFVILLTFYHLYLGKILSKFKIDQNERTHKFYRLINEIPTILLILIVFVVIFKPL